MFQTLDLPGAAAAGASGSPPGCWGMSFHLAIVPLSARFCLDSLMCPEDPLETALVCAPLVYIRGGVIESPVPGH